MTFSAYEQSTESGRPIRCYRFMFDDASKVFGYTSADTEQFLDDGEIQVWCAPVPIKDDGIRLTGDKIADALNITASSDIEPAAWYRRSPPSTPIRVSVHDRHVDDNEFVVAYVGEITEVSFDDPGQAKFVCNAIGASMDREGLRLCWQRSCPYTIYDGNCKVNAAIWKLDVLVVDITASSVMVEGMSGQPDGKFNGGYIEFMHPVKGLMTMTIRSQIGNSMSIFEGTNDMFPGMDASIYPGCAHTPEACTTFGNYDNYGGVRSLPGKSPFDGTPVF